MLEKLLTDYIRNIAAYNNLTKMFPHPIAVSFGSDLPINYVCASDEIFNANEHRAQCDETTFK